MAVKSRAVTVATTATQLDSTTDGYRSSPSLALYNSSAVTVYIGGSDVTTANGLPIPASSWSPGFGLGEGEGIYGVVAADTAAVRVIETGV